MSITKQLCARSVFRDVLVCPRFLDMNVNTYGKQNFNAIPNPKSSKSQPLMPTVAEAEKENSATSKSYTASQPRTPFTPGMSGGEDGVTPPQTPNTPFSRDSHQSQKSKHTEDSKQSNKSKASSGAFTVDSFKRSFGRRSCCNFDFTCHSN